MKAHPSPFTELDGLQLSEDRRRAIHLAAQDAIIAATRRRPIRHNDPSLAGAADLMVMGAFVTLKRSGELRACCGVLGHPMPLGEALTRAARRTAQEDMRLPPVSPTELPYLDLSVSLLHSFWPIEEEGEDRLLAVEVGRHGLQIRQGSKSGILLPNVAVERGMDARNFLRAACRKAGLPLSAWRDDSARLMTFEAVSFGGPIERDDGAPISPKFGQPGVESLADQALRFIAGICRGAIPHPPAFDCPDEVVSGLILTLRIEGEEAPIRSSGISFRPGYPLPALLSRYCQEVAAHLRMAGQVPVAAELAILDDPAIHGTIDAPDLRGFDPTRRALLRVGKDSITCAFDPDSSDLELLERVRHGEAAGDEEPSLLSSLAVIASDPHRLSLTTKRIRTASTVRPPAVAGAFYPEEPGELARLVDRLLGSSPGEPEDWPVAMVPHAGLRYSGAIAAAVLHRIRIPETVIILSPKHTRQGADWAIAPHSAWELPGGSLLADPDLAAILAESIPGLRFDAAAHEREHGIEVELPFLARLAPETRIVGITIGAGHWDDCRRFAEGLARALAERHPRPLLLISSDMNHFAPDAENRHLDALAMKALESLDPEYAYRAIAGRKISMCGLIPAAIALEAQRQMDGLSRSARVAYATSADAGADPGRVVGYAGMLFG